MYNHTVLYQYSVQQQQIVPYNYVIKKKIPEKITTITKLATIPGLTKTEFKMCPLRIVITDLFMFECDTFKRKLMSQT